MNLEIMTEVPQNEVIEGGLTICQRKVFKIKHEIFVSKIL